MKKWKKISDYLFFQEGPGVRNHQYTSNGVKLINVANLVNGRVDLSTSERYISIDEAYGKYKHFLADEGDLIIASSGIKVDYFDKKMGLIKKEDLPICMNTSTIRFKSIDKSKLNINYFMYYLKSQSFKDQLSKQITGSAQLNFGPSHLKKMEFPIVEIGEQSLKISVLGNIESQIRLKKQQLTEYDQLIKSQFVEMFGDPEVNPYSWAHKPLNELGELGRGKSKHRPRNAPELLGGNYPLVQTGDIANSSLYITEYNSTYSELGLKQSKIWNAGTLCITIAANIAKTGILKFDACFPDSVVGFIPNNQTNNIFIHYWFSFFQESIEKHAPESAQKNINLRILEGLNVIVPDIDLQKQFSKFVDQVEKLKFSVQKSLDETQELFDSLMQEYFG